MSNPRPAKRQRRSTVIKDDTTSDDFSKLQTKSPARSTTQLTLHDKIPSSPDSPVKPKRIAHRPTSKPSPRKDRLPNTLTAEGKNTKSLHKFFSKASDEQRWHRRSQTPDVNVEADTIEDDIIDDDSYDEAFKELVKGSSLFNTTATSQTGLQRSSRSCTPISFASSSQRFTKPSAHETEVSSSTNSHPDRDNDSYQPWADRYAPTTLGELAVHKKKVQDVQRWLQDVYDGRSRQRLLVLKGPAGTGKTVTIRLISQMQNVNIVSWQNPDVSGATISSTSAQFEDFLNRGRQYGALALKEENTKSHTGSKRRLLLIEEFPTTTTRSFAALDSFRRVFLQYLADCSQSMPFGSRISSLDIHPPVAMIISETLLSSSTGLNDSFTAHRLLGSDLSNHPLVTTIEYNPVASTFVSKALDLIMRKEARKSQRKRAPGSAVLQKLAEVGDIRSAVNSLEFLCTRGDVGAEWSGTVAATTKRGSKNSALLTKMEQDALQLVGSRESTLDMFHAAGKVLYNKREETQPLNGRTDPSRQPSPQHLMRLHRSASSQVNIESLFNETGTDIQTFISTLHENYVLSCNHDDFVDYLDNCSHVLSDSDILNPESKQQVRSRGNARMSQASIDFGVSDTLRQDEISFQVATRGLLFSLPFPVHRATPPSGRKTDAFKMFYPASLRLWKVTEEIHDSISYYATSLLRAENGSFDRSKAAPDTGVASWKNRVNAFDLGSIPVSAASVAADEGEQHSAPRADSSEYNLVLEILPYRNKIQSGLNKADTSMLQKITQLRGIHVSGEEPFDDEDSDGNLGAAIRPQISGEANVNNTCTGFVEKVESAHRLLSFRQQQQQQQRTKSVSSNFPSNPNNKHAGSQSMKEQGRGRDRERDQRGNVEQPTLEILYIEDDDIVDSD